MATKIDFTGSFEVKGLDGNGDPIKVIDANTGAVLKIEVGNDSPVRGLLRIDDDLQQVQLQQGQSSYVLLENEGVGIHAPSVVLGSGNFNTGTGSIKISAGNIGLFGSAPAPKPKITAAQYASLDSGAKAMFDALATIGVIGIS